MNWSGVAAIAFLLALLWVRNKLLELVAAADDIAGDLRASEGGLPISHKGAMQHER